MVRKTATHIDPVKVTAAALKTVKCASDYHQIGSANGADVFSRAWEKLAPSEQQRISDLVASNEGPHPQLIADQMAACGNKIELMTLKSHYGEVVIKSAWKLLDSDERSRLTAICQNEPTEETAVVETPTIYKVESETKLTKRNLIDLTSDLQQLDNLLDTIDGNITPDLQIAIDELLTQREETNDAVMEKLDNYCGLIQSRLMWIAARKAESDRLAKLAESDTKVVDFLRSRLKSHLEAIDQRKLRTKRFNISVRTAGGKQSLRLNVENPKDLPQRFQRVIVEPDNQLLRDAIEADDHEAKQFAYLAERSTYVAIN